MATVTCQERRTGKRLSLEIISPPLKQTELRKSQKVESVIKASITNKRTNVILWKSHMLQGEPLPINSTELHLHSRRATIWECASCAQTCLGKTCFLFYVPECSSRAMLYYWSRLWRRRTQRAKKNDELQNNNISLSRSLHIIVHNHW